MVKKMPLSIISLLAFALFALLSCQQNQIFNQSKTIDENGWHKDSIASFKLPVLDTINPYNIFINIRNTNSFPFSNLYLIAEVNHPNGKQQIDTLQYQMAKPSGEWLGVGATSVKENKLWYLQNFQFNENGSYRININQAMRTNGDPDGLLYLKGILDVGIQVESTSQQR